MNKYLYDIHNHILPGVDDGSDSMQLTMRLIKTEYESGVRNIMFTPHYFPRSSTSKNEELSENIAEAFRNVCEVCKKEYPDIRLGLGSELFYRTEIIEELKCGRANTMGNTEYVLTEFDTDIKYSDMKKAIQDYIFAGYKPILAHVERFACLYKEYDNMDLLREMGVLFQMNGENFIEGLFSRNKKYCAGLVKDGYIDFISTDTHNDTTRKPNLAEAVEYLYKKIDGEFLDRILYDNPEMLFKKID